MAWYRERRFENRMCGHMAGEEASRMHRHLTATITYYAQRPQEIPARLAELDREWDMDRTIEFRAGVAVAAGMVLGAFSRRWRALPLLASAYMIHHALAGCRPPEPCARRMGLRTRQEIDAERFALKALRGDFRDVDPEAPGQLEEKVLKALDAVGLNSRFASPVGVI